MPSEERSKAQLTQRHRLTNVRFSIRANSNSASVPARWKRLHVSNLGDSLEIAADCHREFLPLIQGFEI